MERFINNKIIGSYVLREIVMGDGLEKGSYVFDLDDVIVEHFEYWNSYLPIIIHYMCYCFNITFSNNNDSIPVYYISPIYGTDGIKRFRIEYNVLVCIIGNKMHVII